MTLSNISGNATPNYDAYPTASGAVLVRHKTEPRLTPTVMVERDHEGIPSDVIQLNFRDGVVFHEITDMGDNGCCVRLSSHGVDVDLFMPMDRDTLLERFAEMLAGA